LRIKFVILFNMDTVSPSMDFTQKLNRVIEKMMEKSFVFIGDRNEETYVACQEILSVFGANYTSVMGIVEIINDVNKTDLQRNTASEDLQILAMAAFKVMNLFFKRSGQNLVTSVLDPEEIEEFLPESLKGLGSNIIKADLRATLEEKGVLLKERKRLFDEEEKMSQKRIEKLLK
jgi:hypothetical protein